MKIIKISFVFILFLIICSFTQNITTKDSHKGAVCFKVGACDYMIVCLKNGNYSVCQDYFDKCDEGDILVGEFQSYGFTDAYNLTKDDECRIYVEDWEVSNESAMDEWKEECN